MKAEYYGCFRIVGHDETNLAPRRPGMLPHVFLRRPEKRRKMRGATRPDDRLGVTEMHKRERACAKGCGNRCKEPLRFFFTLLVVGAILNR